MKTKKFFLGLVGIGALYFSACQKSLTFEDTPPNVIDSTANPDSNYLSRVFSNDTFYLAPPNPTTPSVSQLVENFIYDSQKRLIKIALATATAPNTNFYNRMELSYNTNDSLPYKVRTIGFSADTTNHFLFYSVDGKLIKDSIITKGIVLSIANQRSVLINYSYSTNKIFSIFSYKNSYDSATNYVGKDTAILDTKGNVLSLTTYLKPDVSTAFFLYSKTINTFDNNPNLYNKLPGLKLFFITSCQNFGLSYPELLDIGLNNTTSSKTFSYTNSIFAPPVVADSTISNSMHTYKLNGYPNSIKRITDSGILSYTSKGKFDFFYTAL
jgi:hypothetical protein